ncbi:MAG: hypothetical protein OJF62_003409 [Pseudolabrys sp.]|jgi:hypothetical protein|nr:hypothetical protein [Pseudolabrys sp.]
MADRSTLKTQVVACLGSNKPAGELVDCVAEHFPRLQVNRENDDLVIKGGLHFLIVKRLGPDRFRVTKNVAVPSTNTVDTGGGSEQTLDRLIDEISSLAD